MFGESWTFVTVVISESVFGAADFLVPFEAFIGVVRFIFVAAAERLVTAFAGFDIFSLAICQKPPM